MIDFAAFGVDRLEGRCPSRPPRDIFAKKKENRT